MSLQKEMRVITNAIKHDEGYKIAWLANIAMAFQDEYSKNNPNMSQEEREKIHTISNKSAENFLDLLCRDNA